jgi:sialate O-acetylesterase
MIVDCHRAFLMLRLLLLTLAAAALSTAEVRLNGLFTDGAVFQRDRHVPVWGTARDGEKVTVHFQQQTVSTTAQNGNWRVELLPMKAGGPHQMSVEGDNRIVVHDILIGEVWICSGQSNMELHVAQCDRAAAEIADSANSMLHLLRVPMKAADEPQSDVRSQWKECGPSTVGRFSGVGYFFGRDLQKSLGVPVGLIDASYGGTPAEAWMSRKTLESRPEFRSILEEEAELARDSPRAMKQYEADLAQWAKDAEVAKRENRQPPVKPQIPFGPFNFRRPTGLYKGMVLPLVPYAMRGVVWYQGERNSPRAYQYRTLFPAMISDWRALWSDSFPFLFVQLAPYGASLPEPRDALWAELREAQLLTSLSVPNTAMAVITDVGEHDNIHPVRKQPVGARLALAARALAYQEKIEYSGPIYRSMEVRGDKIMLSFDHLGGGLVARSGTLAGFAICGLDHKFVNAMAEIRGDQVWVWSPSISSPIAVRYGWAAFPQVNLWNAAGLPASPFRTDSFPGLTGPAQ